MLRRGTRRSRLAVRRGLLTGTEHGTHATFAYKFMYGDYVATSTISADRTRMTGHMTDGGVSLPYPTVWVKLTSDAENWLPAPFGKDEGTDRYDLALTSADPGATEYVTGRSYAMVYVRGTPRGGIGGDLGTFSYLELTPYPAAPDVPDTLQAGPVAFTEPQLAVSLAVQLQNNHFTQVTATTGSGHHFTFTATLLQK